MQTDPFGGGAAGSIAPSISLPGGPPAGGDMGGGDTGQSKSFDDNIRDALDSLRSALQAGDADHEELLMASKAETGLQQILAAGQKLVDQAVGGGPATKLVRKQTLKSKAGGGGGYGG